MENQSVGVLAVGSSSSNSGGPIYALGAVDQYTRRPWRPEGSTLSRLSATSSDRSFAWSSRYHTRPIWGPDCERRLEPEWANEFLEAGARWLRARPNAVPGKPQAAAARARVR
jgi:hypothetical protein